MNYTDASDAADLYNIKLLQTGTTSDETVTFSMSPKRYPESKVFYDPVNQRCCQAEDCNSKAVFGWEQCLDLIHFENPINKDVLIITNSPTHCVFLNTIGTGSIAMVDDNERQWLYLEHVILPTFKKVLYWIDEDLSNATVVKGCLSKMDNIKNLPVPTLDVTKKADRSVGIEDYYDDVATAIFDVAHDGIELLDVMELFNNQ